jgi:hypothetical protein
MAETIEDVVPQVQEALDASPIYALRHLRVEQMGQMLLLSGVVSSFYHKQLAQELVRAVTDGFEVVNMVRVVERR